MNQNRKNLLLFALPTILVSLFSVLALILAWQEPSQTPPQGNVPAPINVGTTTQYKQGALGIGGVLVGDSDAYFAGNVGIGTTAPTYKLDVSGDINASGVYRKGGIAGVSVSCGSGTTPSGITISGGIVTSAGSCTPIGGGGESYWTLSGSNLYPTNTNWNVGIGTTAPNTKLEVAGTITAGPASGGRHIIVNDIAGAKWALGTGGYDLTFYKHKSDTNTWETALIIQGDGATNVPQGFSFFAGGSERLTITSNGNVGIGTRTPGAKLEVAGQIKITGGNPGAGKVLTSDASGLASWKSFGAVNKSVLVKRDINGYPSCPSGWSDGGTGLANYGGSNVFERYCYRTDIACRILVKRDIIGYPSCPSGWSDGGTGISNYGGANLFERYCYICQ